MHYKGDLAPSLTPKFARPGVHLLVRHNPNTTVSFKYSFTGGRIFADDSQMDDKFANTRNRLFNTSISELAAQMEYNFFDYRSEKTRRAWSPYLFGGVAVYKFNPLENDKPTYKTFSASLPFGAGVKFVIIGQWNLGLEFGARKTFTDYLDDLGGPLNTSAKFQNGIPDNRDLYTYTSLSVSYTFYKIRCPDFY